MIFCRILRMMLGMNFPGLQCRQDEKWTCSANGFTHSTVKCLPQDGCWRIATFRLQRRFWKQNDSSPPVSVWNLAGVYIRQAENRKNCTQASTCFSDLLEVPFWKRRIKRIGLLIIPFQVDRFSFCASKFEDAICRFLIQQFQKKANQQLRVAFMVSHCFWRLRLYSRFEV